MLTTIQDNNNGAVFSIFLEVKSISVLECCLYGYLQGPEIDFGQPYEVYIGKNCSLNRHSHLIHGANTNFEVPTKNFSPFLQIYSVLNVRESIDLSLLNFCPDLRSALMHRMEVFGSLDRLTGFTSQLTNNLLKISGIDSTLTKINDPD